MTQSKVKAEITTVSIGPIQFQGLMLPDGTFGMGVPQIAELFGTPKNYASREYKRLLGESFRPSKITSTLGNQKVNFVNLKTFELVLRKLDKRGNKIAEQLADSLIGLSLQQLFCDAFEIKFDKEDRQAWLTARMEGITVRNNLTDAIADYLSVYRDKLSINEHKFVYVHCTNAVYKLVFGKDAKQLRVIYKCDNPRDAMEREYLKQVEYIELTAAGILKVGNGSIKPLEAVQRACRLVKSIGVFS